MMATNQEGPGSDGDTSELRCQCGYLLQGLKERRCPECGRTFTGKRRRRKKPYLLRGFRWGFGIVVVPTLVWTAIALYDVRKDSTGIAGAFVLMYAAVGLAVAVVTGLIGMWIGYGIYTSKRG